MQLAKVSPDLLSSLNATMTTPLEPTPPNPASRQVKIISPVMAARAKRQGYYHQKSFSMAEGSLLATPKSSRVENSPHRRTSSMLVEPVAETTLGTPKSLVHSTSHSKLFQPTRPLERRSSSAHHHSRSVSMLDQRNGNLNAIRLEDLSSRKILHMSTSELKQLHQRSSSSPYEGFVL